MSQKTPHPVFTSCPDPDKIGPTIEVIRISGKPKRGLILASHDPMGCYTHWRNNRKLPCLGDDCKCLDTGEDRRWYGYVAIWQPRTHNMAILEYTRAAAPPFVEYFKKHRTLRGARCDAYRRSEKTNSRLIVHLYEGDYPTEEIPTAPNRQRILCKIWGLRFEDFDDAENVAALQTLQDNAFNPAPSSPRIQKP